MYRTRCLFYVAFLTSYALWCDGTEVKAVDFNGMRFRMAAETWKPFLIVSEESDRDRFTGVMAKILDYLQISLNFSTSLARPPDGAWGALDDEGHWSGMVGMVKRNEVDFALGENS